MHRPPKIHNTLFVNNFRHFCKPFPGVALIMRPQSGRAVGLLIIKRRDLSAGIAPKTGIWIKSPQKTTARLTTTPLSGGLPPTKQDLEGIGTL